MLLSISDTFWGTPKTNKHQLFCSQLDKSSDKINWYTTPTRIMRWPVFCHKVFEMNTGNLSHTHIISAIYYNLQQPHQMLWCVLELHKTRIHI